MIILLYTGTNKGGGYFAPRSVFFATYMGLIIIWAIINTFALNLIAFCEPNIYIYMYVPKFPHWTGPSGGLTFYLYNGLWVSY